MRLTIVTMFFIIVACSLFFLGLASSWGVHARTIPASITECKGAAAGSSFCDVLSKNTTWAINKELAPGICAGVGVFGPSSSFSTSSSNAKKKNKKKKAPPLRGNILSQPQQLSSSSSSSASFPGYKAASKLAFLSSGQYTYESWSTVDDDSLTMFDMASVSKIMGATTATAQLYQLGFLDLDEKVASPKLLGPNFASKGKGNITVRNLLLHNAGYPPDPTPYWYNSPKFPCKNNQRYHPDQNFDCVETIYNNLVFNQTLVYPTGSKFIYSDLSMITLMFVVGKVVIANKLVPDDQWPPVCAGLKSVRTCAYYAWVYVNVFKRYGLDSTMFIPTSPLRTPPQWDDAVFHHGLVMGYVSDQNAYSLGGISGHAGVFSTARDVMTWMSIWINEQDPAFLNATTIKLFTTVANLTQSSRALGWDTNDQPNPPCGSLSKKTFTHEGYTGTQICGDPTTGTVTVLLANGRYPNYHVDGMIEYRPIFNSLVQSLLK